MEEYTQITLDQWMQWKEDIRKKLEETADNFVHIGYRLKQIRDSGMYDGAADIFEFAEREYGLGKSTVSRFIAINEKYSEGGNSLELKEEFRGFSSSKLAEMLTLPDNEIELITEKTTIREIRELKSFNMQGPEGMEEAEGCAQEERSPLESCIIDFFKSRKEMLNKVMKHLTGNPPEYKQAAELMAPSGQASHKKRIVFLFMYDWNTGIKYKLMTDPDPVSMSWPQLLNVIYQIFRDCDQTDIWRNFYGEEEKTDSVQQDQSEEAVATSQREGEKRINTKSESPSKIMEEPAEQKITETETVPEEQESVSKKEEIVPKVLEIVPEEPESVSKEEEPAQEEPENVENTKCEAATEEVEDQEVTEDVAAGPAEGKYEAVIKELIEKTAFQAKRISKELNEGRKALAEYINIKVDVHHLYDNLGELVKYIEASLEEDEENENEEEDDEE